MLLALLLFLLVGQQQQQQQQQRQRQQQQQEGGQQHERRHRKVSAMTLTKRKATWTPGLVGEVGLPQDRTRVKTELWVGTFACERSGSWLVEIATSESCCLLIPPRFRAFCILIRTFITSDHQGKSDPVFP